MDVKTWKFRNRWHKIKGRLRHPWPLYKSAGGINAVVTRADGSTENLGRVSTTYIQRHGWSVGTK